MGGHSRVGTEKHFRTKRRPRDGAFHPVRKCIIGNATSTAAFAP